METQAKGGRAALVLEGGAMRGLFTAGVIDIWLEAGVTFPAAVAVSAGAVFGCNLKSGQHGRVLRYNKKYCRDPRYASLRSLLRTGDVFGAQFCYHDIPWKLDPWDQAAYAANPMRFFVVATDANTGEAVYHECAKGDEEDIEWFRASASMPLASRMVPLDGRELSDGGTADSIPVDFAESLGFGRTVIVLTQPRGFVKVRAHPWWLYRLCLRRRPALLQALATRADRYNATLRAIEAREAAGRAFVLRPPAPLAIPHVSHHPDELQRVYDLGRQVAQSSLPSLQRFLLG